MDYAKLRNELDTDPLVRGYAVMTDAQAADDLNIVYRTRDKEHLAGAEVYEQVDNAEFLALTAAQQDEVWNITHLSGEGQGILVTPGSKARARFIAIFGGGSNTITSLSSYITENISRAVEIGLGLIRESDVVKARAL